jgi:MFS superfamily sulfate permease-like transporter
MLTRLGILASLEGYKPAWLGRDTMAGRPSRPWPFLAPSSIPPLRACRPVETRWFVLDASAVIQVDSTAASMLEGVRGMFAERGIAFGIVELHSEPMEVLRRAGLPEKIGGPMIFEDLEELPVAFERLQHSG